ncbi:hypothetical protein [uncultured Sphingomonas sp.]|jgi:hypothetical protein|uniref:hypothetical protein n=1 Tax=uncultured Sphingomonas sp. TaxID=158754 RepID=UPI002631BB36|nr:hypothetical protein [uncultured Sphingomonas sp.]
MNQHPFMGFVAFQQEVLRFQKRQLDLMETALKAGQDEVAFQKSAHEAAEAGIQAWQNWIALWSPKG